MNLLAAMLASLLPLGALAAGLPPVQSVFIIVMENHDWSEIKGSPDAPFINSILLPQASHCEQYHVPFSVHPSLPNYLWLEGGTNFGVLDDEDPALDHQGTSAHLATLLNHAGISWKAYQEDIGGTDVPLTSTNLYAVRHNPFVYFDDVTGTNNPNCAYGIAHVRPYAELTADLTNHTVARYNFITPNVCNDMHDSCYPAFNSTRQGDDWLAREVPKILNSAAYQNCGALFIIWDEDSGYGDSPIGLILLSPLARGGGYFNNVFYTHSSMVRTMQEIFGVTPLLADAANATDLSDLFMPFGFSSIVNLPGTGVQMTTVGLTPGKTNILLASADCATWTALSTNSVATNTFTFLDTSATNLPVRFYRLMQIP
jgi:hypothetical protein